MFKLAISYLNISAFEYYELTPRELQLMFEGYNEKYKQDIEMQAIAMRVAVVNANRGKSYKVFREDGKPNNVIDPSDKKKELEELKKKFS